MTDGQIVAAIIAEIKTQLGIYGIAPADLRVSRSSQPTAQHAGAAESSEKYQVFIEPVTNTNVGWRSKWTPEARTVTHTKQKTYQISALADFDPSNPGDMPAHELAQVVADMLEHPDSIRTLTSKGVYPLSSGPVRPAFQLNQSDEYESMPNFDMVVTYNAEYTKPVPAVDDVTGEIDRV